MKSLSVIQTNGLGRIAKKIAKQFPLKIVDSLMLPCDCLFGAVAESGLRHPT